MDCDNCGKTTIPVCHVATSDATVRSFCSLGCAMAFKVTQPVQLSKNQSV